MDTQITLGYVRVSTQEQTESGLSIQSQIQRIEQFCEFRGLELNKIIHDEGISASIPLSQRQGGSELIDFANKNKNVTIIAVKLDRLFRDALDCLSVVKDWNKNGVSLQLLDLGVDTKTPQGKAFLTNAAAYAELERNLISERTKEALKQVRAQGGVLGSNGYGWSRTQETDANGRKKIVLETEEFQTLIECRTLRDMGWKLQQIADKFNRENRKTKRGGRWFPSTVRNCCNAELPNIPTHNLDVEDK